MTTPSASTPSAPEWVHLREHVLNQVGVPASAINRGDAPFGAAWELQLRHCEALCARVPQLAGMDMALAYEMSMLAGFLDPAVRGEKAQPTAADWQAAIDKMEGSILPLRVPARIRAIVADMHAQALDHATPHPAADTTARRV